MSASVAILVALRAEALPIARSWGLERESDGPFQRWSGLVPDAPRGEAPRAELIVSGVGRDASIAATSWLGGRLGRDGTPSVWVNFGIAGARSLSGRPARVGEPIVASKVCLANGQDSKVWFPPWTVQPESDSTRRMARVSVHTVDRPETEFAEDGVYEMEAAGFLSAAERFVSAEMAQVMKVVSDTPESGLESIDRDLVGRVVEGSQACLAALSCSLVSEAVHSSAEHHALLDSIAESAGEGFRLSATRARQWRDLIRRLVALEGQDSARETLEEFTRQERRRPVDELAKLVDSFSSDRQRTGHRS